MSTVLATMPNVLIRRRGSTELLATLTCIPQIISSAKMCNPNSTPRAKPWTKNKLSSIYELDRNDEGSPPQPPETVRERHAAINASKHST
jgi:hypothetical protein